MIRRPYDMTVSLEVLHQAGAWWRNLSNNQMKELKSRYFPNYSFVHERMIHQMWEEEGKPEPQELIPVGPFTSPNRYSVNGVPLPHIVDFVAIPLSTESLCGLPTLD